MIINHEFFGDKMSHEFLKWHPGWMANQYKMNSLVFWWKNWGMFFALILLSIWETKYYRHPVVIGGILIFILSNLFLFSPWDWNN